MALVYLLFTSYFYKQKKVEAQSIFTAISVFAVGLFILSFNFTNLYRYAFLFLLNGTVGIWVALQFKSIRTVFTSGFFYVPTAFYILYQIPNFISIENLLWITFLVSIVVIYIALYRYLPKHYGISIRTLDISLTVGQVIGIEYWLSLLVSFFPTAFEDGLEHILFLLLLLPLLVFFFAYRWKHGKYVSYAATIEILLIYPVVLVSGLINDETSFMYFVNLGVEILYVGILSYLYFIIWKGQPRYLPIYWKKSVPFLAIVMQVTIFIFLNKWLLTFMEVLEVPSDYVYFIHSIVMMLFAFASISLGKRFALKYVRNIGLALILITIFKLIFIDLAQVSIYIRALLFIVVGILGMWYSKSFYTKEDKTKAEEKEAK